MSNIDVSKPVTGNPTTQSVRDNFTFAKEEIEALEAKSLSPLDFGGVGDGVTDDSAAILACSVAALAQGMDVDFGGYMWLLGTQLALTNSHDALKWRLRGATIKKGFNGTLITLVGVDQFSVDGVGTFDGQHGTFTGKGLAFSGGCNDPYFAPGIRFTSFTDTHIEFAADSGARARVPCTFLPGSGQTDARYIHCTGTDTLSMNRNFSDCVMPSGYIDLDGAQDTTIGNAAFRRVEVDSTCEITKIINCVWGNAGSAMTISGPTTTIIGCRFSGDVTLDANFGGVFALNRFTSGSLNDLSVGGNTIVVQKSPVGLIDTSFVQHAVPADTTEDVLVTVSLPANTLGANDGVEITCYWSWTGSVNAKTSRIRFGASGAGTGGTLVHSSAQTTSVAAVTHTTIHNRNATNSQTALSNISTDLATVVTNLVTPAIDCTADTDIVITGQKASSGETMTLQGYTVRLLDS